MAYYGDGDVQIHMKVDIVAETPHGGLILSNVIHTAGSDGSTAAEELGRQWHQLVGRQQQQPMIEWPKEDQLTAADSEEEAKRRRRERREERRRKKKANRHQGDTGSQRTAAVGTTTEDALETTTGSTGEEEHRPKWSEMNRTVAALLSQPPQLPNYDAAHKSTRKPNIEHRTRFSNEAAADRRRTNTTMIEELTDEMVLNTFEDEQQQPIVDLAQTPIVDLGPDTSFEREENTSSQRLIATNKHQPMLLTETTTTTTTVEVIRHTNNVQDDYEKKVYQRQETLINDPAYVIPTKVAKNSLVVNKNSRETLLNDAAKPEPNKLNVVPTKVTSFPPVSQRTISAVQVTSLPPEPPKRMTSFPAEPPQKQSKVSPTPIEPAKRNTPFAVEVGSFSTEQVKNLTSFVAAEQWKRPANASFSADSWNNSTAQEALAHIAPATVSLPQPVHSRDFQSEPIQGSRSAGQNTMAPIKPVTVSFPPSAVSRDFQSRSFQMSLSSPRETPTPIEPPTVPLPQPVPPREFQSGPLPQPVPPREFQSGPLPQPVPPRDFQSSPFKVSFSSAQAPLAPTRPATVTLPKPVPSRDFQTRPLQTAAEPLNQQKVRLVTSQAEKKTLDLKRDPPPLDPLGAMGQHRRRELTIEHETRLCSPTDSIPRHSPPPPPPAELQQHRPLSQSNSSSSSATDCDDQLGMPLLCDLPIPPVRFFDRRMIMSDTLSTIPEQSVEDLQSPSVEDEGTIKGEGDLTPGGRRSPNFPYSGDSRRNSIDSVRSSVSDAMKKPKQQQAQNGTGTLYNMLNGQWTTMTHSELDDVNEYDQGRITPLAHDMLPYADADSLRSQESVVSAASSKKDKSHPYFDSQHRLPSQFVPKAVEVEEKSFEELMKGTAKSPLPSLLSQKLPNTSNSPPGQNQTETSGSPSGSLISAMSGEREQLRSAELVRRRLSSERTTAVMNSPEQLADTLDRMLREEEKSLNLLKQRTLNTAL